MVCDNSANVHICNKRKMFVGEIRKCTNQGVATIGGKGNQPSGIGTVRWIWRDGSGKSHEYLVKYASFSPQSPINILSVTCFARQLNDLTGTGIDKKQLNLVSTGTQANTRLRYIIHLPISQRFI